MHDGSSADRTVKAEFIQHRDYEENDQIISLFMSEIEGTQNKINYNSSINNAHINKLKCVIKILTYTLLLLLFFAIIVNFI